MIVFLDGRLEADRWQQCKYWGHVQSGTVRLIPRASRSGPKEGVQICLDRAYIATRATILGVEIGEGAVVAAGAVVTKNVPPRAVLPGCLRWYW